MIIVKVTIQANIFFKHSAITTNSKSREEQLVPMRIRSSSASEASKPILLNRRPTISGNKIIINSSPLSGKYIILIRSSQNIVYKLSLDHESWNFEIFVHFKMIVFVFCSFFKLFFFLFFI